jgi:hypothetical protein
MGETGHFLSRYPPYLFCTTLAISTASQEPRRTARRQEVVLVARPSIPRGLGMTRPKIPQALLRPDFAPLYPGIPPNEWRPAAVMTDQVLALRLRAKHRVPLTRDHVLDAAHFEFRDVGLSATSRAERDAPWGGGLGRGRPGREPSGRGTLE